MADTTAVLEARVQVVDDSATQNFLKLAGAADTFSKRTTSSFQTVKREIASFRSNLAVFGGAFAQIAGFGIGFESLVTGLRGMFNEWKKGEESLSAFAARERLAGTETAGLTDQIRKLAETNREVLGATTEETASLAIRARAIGLTGDEISAAVTAAETMGKVFKSDVRTSLDLVAKGMTGSKEAMRDFGVELGLRINTAEEFAAALRKVQAELLDLRAKGLATTESSGVFNQAQAFFGSLPGGINYRGLGEKVKSEIAALKREAAELRAEASKVVGPQSGADVELTKKLGSAAEATRRFSLGVDQLVASSTHTDTVPDRLAAVAARSKVELERLTASYQEASKKVEDASTGQLFDPSLLFRQKLVEQFGAGKAAISDRADAESRRILQEKSDFELNLLDETQARKATGRERELIESVTARNREFRSLEEWHRKGLVGEEAYQEAKLGIVSEFLERQKRLTGSGGDGALDALRDGADDLADAYGRGRRAVEELGDAFETNLGGALHDFVTGTKSAGEAWKGFVHGFFDDLARDASAELSRLAKDALFAGLRGIFGGGGGGGGGWLFADGGWRDAFGVHGGRFGDLRQAAGGRAVDVRAFADGGVANRPTLGLFGEAGEEAFVKMKNGRIPVSLNGNRGGNVINLYLSAIDTQSGISFLAQHREFLWGLQRDGFDRRSEFRGMARRS